VSVTPLPATVTAGPNWLLTEVLFTKKPVLNVSGLGPKFRIEAVTGGEPALLVNTKLGMLKVSMVPPPF